MKVVAIILLAGKSTRFDSDVSKQVYMICNKPVFHYPLKAFSEASEIDSVCLVTDEVHRDEISKYVKENKFNKANVILGGETRQLSVKNGLDFYKDEDESTIVIIHDGARPLIDYEIIKTTIDAAIKYEAVSTYLPMEDTAAVSDQNGSILEFIDRNKIVRIQTPQAFKLGIIKDAHKYAKNSYATDDCSLVMALPHQVKLIPGSKKLAKLTTKEDVDYLKTFIL